MGAYRFILAVAVALAHAGAPPFGIHLGVAAVISFYILSGFVMAALIDRKYTSPEQSPAFYLSRLKRIYPQFLFYFFATALLIKVTGLSNVFVAEISFWRGVANLLIFPLGLFTPWLQSASLVPQAWSLGLETMFYAIAPWLLLYTNLRMVALASVAVFIIAILGLIDPDLFAYRTLPGTLFIFLSGSIIYRTRAKRAPPLNLTILWMSALMALICTFNFPSIDIGYNKAVLSGYLIGLPAIWSLRNWKKRRVDDLLGNLSYGVFLNHIMIIWALQSASGVDRVTPLLTAAMLFISIPLSFFSHFVLEGPLQRLIALRAAVRSRAAI